jgi:hypothetical protein
MAGESFTRWIYCEDWNGLLALVRQGDRLTSRD